MPKVVVSNSKGLYQESGTGFELSDSHVKPAIETVKHATHVLQFTGPDVAAAIDGQYFDISSTTENYRLWFDHNNDGAGGDSEPASAGRTLVPINISAAGGTASDVAQATAVAAALNGISAGAVFQADETGNLAGTSEGQVTVYTKVAGESLASFSAGTTASPTAASCTTADGSGQAAVTVDKRVTIIAAPSPGANDVAITAIADLTLANGAYAGQEKVLIFQGANGETVDVTTTLSYLTATDASPAANKVVLTATTDSACNITLLWDGAAWATLHSNAPAGGKAAVEAAQHQTYSLSLEFIKAGSNARLFYFFSNFF